MKYKFDNTWLERISGKEGKNKIVLDSSRLLSAALVRKCNNPDFARTADKKDYNFKGIQFHAIGTGDSTWTPANYASGLSIETSGLFAEYQREVPYYCKFLEEFVSTAENGTTNLLIDKRLSKYKPSDLKDRVLYIGSGTNAGTSGLVTYTPESSILTNDVGVGKVYVTPAFLSGIDDSSVYEIRNVPVSGTKITNKVHIKTLFTSSSTKTIREHGLFGANATTTLNSGILFNHVMLSGTNQITHTSGTTVELEFFIKLG